MKCSARDGGRRWSRPGGLTADGSPTAIPGVSSRTAQRVWCSGAIRSTPAGATGGSHPVHEVLQWVGEGAPGPTAAAEGVQLDHHPDPEKSRGQYLNLLELSVEEDPEDDRNMHYLGREYLFRGRWEDSIRILKRHLAMPQAVWRDERAASMRFLARACLELDRQNEALEWYLRAAAEAPYLREPWVELGPSAVPAGGVGRCAVCRRSGPGGPGASAYLHLRAGGVGQPAP